MKSMQEILNAGHLTETAIAVISISFFVYLALKYIEKFVAHGDISPEDKVAIKSASTPYWQAVLYFLATILGALGLFLLFSDMKEAKNGMVFLYGFAIFCLLVCMALFLWARRLSPMQVMYANSEVATNFKSLQAEIFNSASLINAGITKVVYILVALAVTGFFLVNKWLAIPFVVTAFLMLTSRHPYGRLLHPDEYYSLPESGGGKDKHCCVLCGGHGIRVRGEYASPATTAHCSKCKEPLYAISSLV